jgi:hypothetical protein
MSILNITNLTDTPERWIEDKYDDTFNEVERELQVEVSDEDRTSYVEGQIDQLEEYMSESKGSELLSIIDNFLFNNDYYADVKEHLTNN